MANSDMNYDDLLASLSVDRVRANIEHITQKIPSRLAGSENARRMAEFSAQQLSAVGVSARVEAIPGLVSFPDKADFKVTGPKAETIEANTLGHSVLTSPGGVSGELLDVGSGGVDGYKGKDAKGRIVLCELSYSPGRHEKQRLAALNGATGCVMMNWGHPENKELPFGSVKPVWGNPTPETLKTEMATLPCIGIARTDGLRLREAANSGSVHVNFSTNVDNCWKDIHLTTAEILPSEDSDYVLVGGHQDSWPGEQATDNAAGSACIIELARFFNERRDQLRRGLALGFWTAHETGTMIASSWYADRNWDDLRDRAVAYLQIDQPACAGHTEWISASSVELRRSHQEIEKALLEGRHANWKRAPKTGDSSFFGLGIPMLAAQGSFTPKELQATALATHGWWHHSTANTIDKLDWAYMRTHLRIYAAWLWNLCTAPVLPYEFVSTADQLIERLGELKAAGESVGLASVLKQVQALRADAALLEQTADTWRRKYAEGKVSDADPGKILDDCFKRLSRKLLPVASTAKGKYGHDSYAYTPQGSVIPGLYDVPKLTSLPRGSEDRVMLETGLVRERNRVSDAIEESRAAIADTLNRLSHL
ncbi:MAG: M28 family peptidase [Pseudorhodoplanes sp.]|uniref:M28 family peptidase n=1 Tax=Pseudorhodoplanes sp. TaxID=1934341 RepID=UPI003D0FDE6C